MYYEIKNSNTFYEDLTCDNFILLGGLLYEYLVFSVPYNYIIF